MREQLRKPMLMRKQPMRKQLASDIAEASSNYYDNDDNEQRQDTSQRH